MTLLRRPRRLTGGSELAYLMTMLRNRAHRPATAAPRAGSRRPAARGRGAGRPARRAAPGPRSPSTARSSPPCTRSSRRSARRSSPSTCSGSPTRRPRRRSASPSAPSCRASRAGASASIRALQPEPRAGLRLSGSAPRPGSLRGSRWRSSPRSTADRIEALRARDEFFWLDLARPAPADLDAAGRAARPPPARARGHARVPPAAEARPLPGHAAARLLVSARVVDDGTAVEPVEVHLHISGGFARHRAPRSPARALDELHDELPGGPHSRGVRRLPRARRADRRAVPGRRPPRGADRRARGAGAAATPTSASSARSTGSSRRSSMLRRLVHAARPVRHGDRGDPRAARA